MFGEQTFAQLRTGLTHSSPASHTPHYDDTAACVYGPVSFIYCRVLFSLSVPFHAKLVHIVIVSHLHFVESVAKRRACGFY